MDETRKAEIIRLQQEIISSMTQSNLKKVMDDLWGEDTKQAGNKGTKEEKQTPAENTEKKAEAVEEYDFESLLKELHSLIGLSSIKEEITSLMNLAKIDGMRKEKGLPSTDISLHMVFSGNPGTGKTMVARLVSKMLKSLGVLSKGQLVEVDRSMLVAGYVGQTAIKTAEMVEKAKGGVLFIDEAYSLTNRGENDYGQEAVETLLKLMEDNRKDLVVIVAGYDLLMEDFVLSNPGLKSRFNRFLHFPDYSKEELCDIFALYCKKAGFRLGEGAREALLEIFASKNQMEFGNARGARNLFEKALVKQANRLAKLPDIQHDMLLTLSKEDIREEKENVDRA